MKGGRLQILCLASSVTKFMAHKNNKNNKDNKKMNPKTKSEMRDMEVEMSKEIGANGESKKLGKKESTNEKRMRRE